MLYKLWTSLLTKTLAKPRILSPAIIQRVWRTGLSTISLREGILLGIGNPLLDICAVVENDFLSKYDLKANNAILAEDKQKPMYQEMVDKYSVDYVAGGATMNSIRVAQWLMQHHKATSFIGAVGNDEFAKILLQKAEETGVDVHYMYHDSYETGTCAVCITNNCRSLVANLAAANHYKTHHIKENWKVVEDAQLYYISGFFLTVSPETIMEVAKHALENDKIFSMNLSAPFLCQFFKEPMMNAMPYVDLLFGNESEALTFAKEQGFGTENIQEIALKIANLPKQSKKPRTVVITQGHDETVVIHDGKVQLFSVDLISPEQIVDTNGAGDAFVGGFLAQYVQGKPMEKCIECAHYCAKQILQVSSVTLVGKPDYT